MMESYKENFEKIRELNSSVFSALERALKHLDVDFYLIGAQSRDVWTNHIELKGKILGVLQAKLSRFSMEAIEQMYAADKNDSKVLEFKLIAETIKGIND